MSTRGPILAGALVIALGLLGSGLWASFVPLEGGVLASGRIAGENERKTVQHLDGGIVSEILIEEGDRVRAGQVLLRLESVIDRERADALNRRKLYLLARQTRLSALRAGAGAWQPPDSVRQVAARDPELAEMVALQQRLFASERAALDGQSAVLNQRARQQETLIDALRKRDRARKEELDIVSGQLKDISPLVAKGYVPKVRQSELRREKSSLDGVRAEIQGRIARAREAIAETRMQLSALEQSSNRSWSNELSEIEENRMQLEGELAVARDKLTRHDVVAPVSGTVMNLNFVTKGGVIAPGKPILDIVPAGESLSVDVRVEPGDIDEVHTGMPARVRLTALPQRSTPVIEGEVTRVSPDTHRDEQTREAYYTARIRLDAEEVNTLAGAEPLYPGMPADVVIVSSQYTLLGALLRPLSDAMFKSFRQ